MDGTRDRRSWVCRCTRIAALTDALTRRRARGLTIVWPLEEAIAAGGDVATAVVVLDGAPTGEVLATMADCTAVRPELGVLVLGPIEPGLDVLLALAREPRATFRRRASPTPSPRPSARC